MSVSGNVGTRTSGKSKSNKSTGNMLGCLTKLMGIPHHNGLKKHKHIAHTEYRGTRKRHCGGYCKPYQQNTATRFPFNEAAHLIVVSPLYTVPRH